MLAEHRRLQDFTVRIEDAFIPVPAMAIANQPRGRVGDAAVQAKPLPLLGRVVILVGRVLGEEEGVVQSARGQ